MRISWKQAGLALLGAAALNLGLSDFSHAQAPPGACGTTTWTLTAGQTIPAGTVTVANDATNIYVTYQIDTATYPSATFGNLHMWVGTTLDNLPKNKQGIPIPGQFPYTTDATGLTSYTFVIPFQTTATVDIPYLCPQTVPLYVVTHAEVSGLGGSGHETAFGGPTPGTGPRWWFYGQYTTCCDQPPVVAVCRTGFGKGGYVFTTDPRANPEGLPSLNLIKNRWGWAINLTAPGNYVYELWAGAGLNKIASGRLAGSVLVNWDGSLVTVTYQLGLPTNYGYSMKELHIYAGDTPPTTVAPGQYGYTQYFDPRVKTHTRSFMVSDTDGDGIWLIAHAVVCR